MPEMINVKREDFIRSYTQQGALTYKQAVAAYDCTMKVLEDAVVNGHRVTLGGVGALVPRDVPPRVVRMGFTKGKGGVVNLRSREYIIGHRKKYAFNLFKRFLQSRQLNWTT
jgi:nucleoid DNA-binding protein